MARAGRPAAGLFVSSSRNRTVAARRGNLVDARCSQGAVEARRRPTPLKICRRARTRPAAASLPLPREIGFAPETSRAAIAQLCRVFRKNHPDWQKENRHGSHRRLSDRARADFADPARDLGGFVVSATILQFLPRPRRDRNLTREPISCSLSRLDDLAMDHVDTAPCEYASPLENSRDEDEPA